MRDDAAFLIGSNDQRRKVGRAPQVLQTCNLLPQGFGRATLDVAVADVDARNEALAHQGSDLVVRRISDDKATPQFERRLSFGVQRAVLVEVQDRGCRRHGDRWQAPQQHQQLSGDAPTAPETVTQQQAEDENPARENEHSGSHADRRQVDVVEIEADEDERRSKQPEEDCDDRVDNVTKRHSVANSNK